MIPPDFAQLAFVLINHVANLLLNVGFLTSCCCRSLMLKWSTFKHSIAENDFRDGEKEKLVLLDFDRRNEILSPRRQVLPVARG